MTTLKAIVGNLAVIRYLVAHGRKYRRCDLERLLDTVDELLQKPESLSTEEIQALQHYVTECIHCFESLNQQEEKSPEQKQEINSLLKWLHRVAERCRQLQDLEQLILRIMLTVKLYQ